MENASHKLCLLIWLRPRGAGSLGESCLSGILLFCPPLLEAIKEQETSKGRKSKGRSF